jgi:integrase
VRTPGDGSVYRTKDGRWRVVITLGLDANGKPKRKYLPGGSTRAQANARLRDALRAKDAGELTAGKDVTVGEWMVFWLENVVRPKCAPKTYAGYASVVKVWITPAIGRHRLSKLTPEHLDAFYADMTAADSRQVRLVHAVLRRSLKIAVRYSRVGRNVAELVDPPVIERDEVEPFSKAEAKCILATAKGARNAARWTVALSLGLRQGEALGLAWDDVDLAAGIIQVRSQLQRKTWRHGCATPCGRKRGVDCPQKTGGGGLILRQPKSKKSRRTVDIPPTLLADLKAHRTAQRKERLQEGSGWVGYVHDGEPVDLVFAQRNGLPIDPTDDREAWLALLEKAKVDRRRLHDARHTAATLLLIQGVDVKVVADILGHSTTTLTRDTYQHVVPELRRAAAKAMEDALWGSDGSSGGSRRTERQRTSTRTRRGRKQA